MRKIVFISFVLSVYIFKVQAQPDRWQQRIKYQIQVNMDVNTNILKGTEKIEYYNNSPDTLDRVFFHLYWNAFQPNSMMDVRSRELGKIISGYDKNGKEVRDWDSRVTDRISKLKPDEEGYQKVAYVKINNKAQKLILHETILEVQLDKPILPRSKTNMDIGFEAQVSVQIRRSGRDNAEGVRFSMSQWYPKMVEYDYEGWNANPYIAREFYGVWGDYDVDITIDKSYMLAGTGTLQNANEIGFGYETGNVKPVTKNAATLTWKFSAQNVHDFVWAADPDYTMIKKHIPKGPILYFVFKKDDPSKNDWYKLADTMVAAYPFMAKTFGPYPYKNYSFIQGGDGGMEYAMATLIKSASIGTALHEWMHAWYQGLMGSNESLYAWMDEGFTTYSQLRISAWLRHDSSFAYGNAYRSYYNLAKSGKEEPMSTHADHYNSNFAYSTDAYSKGAVFLAQLGYITGNQNLDKILLAYYDQWKYKHPNPNDFIRVAEKVSGIELQWYKQYWIYTTKTIDYALGSINEENGKAMITIKKLGDMPMPVDVLVTYKDGSQEMHYIPMNLMYGEKPAENNIPRIVHEEWKWTDPQYQMQISKPVKDIKEIIIDPSERMADVNRVNNRIVVPE